jgi:hypothetical protein
MLPVLSHLRAGTSYEPKLRHQQQQPSVYSLMTVHGGTTNGYGLSVSQHNKHQTG